MAKQFGDEAHMSGLKGLFENGDLVKAVLSESTLDAIRGLRSSRTMDAILAFQNSPAMKAALGIQGSAVSAALAFENSPALRAIEAFQNLPTIQMERFLTNVRPMREYLLRPDFADSVSKFRKAALALESSQASPLAQFFASERSAEIPDLLDASGDAAISIAVSGDFRVATAAELELERQIVGHLEQGKPASALSTEQRSRLILVIAFLMLIMTLIEKESAMRQELCFFQPKIVPTMTSGQVGKAVRNYMCEKEMPGEFLKRYRTVKGNGVRLRAGPGMKAEVLAVNLPDRATLEVLDSGNRNWLHVAVVGEDGVDGWVSRKYTHQLDR